MTDPKDAQARAAIRALQSERTSMEGEIERLREALVGCAEALNSFIYIIAHRFDGDGSYYWMREPTHDEAQAAMLANNNASAALTSSKTGDEI